MPDPSNPPILIQREHNIAVVVFNIPKRRNALDEPARAALMAALQSLAADAEVRAIVLTGSDGHFCAGADVGAMKERPRTFIEQRNIIGIHTHPILRTLFAGPKPCVAAIEGVAFGMGLSLAAACDYVVAADNARLCVAQLRVGLAPDVGIMWTLPRRVGEGKARELMLMAKEISAATALSVGLVNETCAPGQARAAAVEAARTLASIPPMSMALVRSALASRCSSFEETLKAEIDLQAVLARSRDHAEAVAAFVEKRPPRYTGE